MADLPPPICGLDIFELPVPLRWYRCSCSTPSGLKGNEGVLGVRAFWIFGIDVPDWAGGIVGPVRDEMVFRV